MTQPHYAIMRFAKYKAPEISNIEAHNERTKEKYASNPDIDCSRSKYNFHLIEPAGRYRAEAENQIQNPGCRMPHPNGQRPGGGSDVHRYPGVLQWQEAARNPALL